MLRLGDNLDLILVSYSGTICGLLTKHKVKMTGYWHSSFLCVFMDLDPLDVHNHGQKEEANIQPSLPNKLRQ